MKTFNNEQILKLQTGVTDLLAAIGDDPNRSGVIETPERVVKAHAEIFAHTGETQFSDYKLFDTTQDADMVVVEGIPFYSMCEHHLLPFFGTVDVAYVPDGEIIGLSKVPRLVDWASRRPSVQENLTHLIADEMQRIVHPKGLAVNVTARHMCMEMRGINQPGTQTNTSIYRDLLKTDTFLRDSFARRVSQR
ncbi:GTP cyclohydrolase I [Leuconostoc lactis]|uniref:GTP cyclohydrolase I n=1 Tax=Leuconostoc lactis TaxID=1246 RepID=UPI0006DCB7C6|nr:GTP cyclohydrolase I [Leuconostoc lactis]KQB81893.1 GTP cyclohydrolase [Leuconostoc lactis]QEA48001.1 GTP cyclohydrolase I [Leuconostoc lactis]WKY78526.1 GTP cyclohydrolase I [Leuconostoc lactis]HBP98604.1 GTP cyclohydrolase I FolE [Leuconostoc lactis]